MILCTKRHNKLGGRTNEAIRAFGIDNQANIGQNIAEPLGHCTRFVRFENPLTAVFMNCACCLVSIGVSVSDY